MAIETESLSAFLSQYQYQGDGDFLPDIDIKSYLHSVIQKSGPLTRSEIVDLTSIPWTTVYDNLVKLLMKKKVMKFSVKIRRTKGRPKIYYKVMD